MTLKTSSNAPKPTDGSDSPKMRPASGCAEMAPWMADIHRGKQT